MAEVLDGGTFRHAPRRFPNNRQWGLSQMTDLMTVES
jgi:hypothetical protein